MKRVISIIACVALVSCLCLTGCAQQNKVDQSTIEESNTSESVMSSHAITNLAYKTPKAWDDGQSTDTSSLDSYELPVGGSLNVSCAPADFSAGDIDIWMDNYIAGLDKTMRFGLLTKGNMEQAITYDTTVATEEDGVSYQGLSRWILSNQKVYWVIAIVPSSEFSAQCNDIKDVMDSAVLAEPVAPYFEEPEASSEPASEPTPVKPTVSQQNALKKAKSYLSSGAFSYTGLIDQLQYNSFSVEDATYAADNCGGDWNAQALKKATSYLSSGAFSYDGLIEQLEFNGFTEEQATYAADNCGGDWNAQAAKKAASYMKSGAFSRDGLIGQLEFNGFTEEQATYGADSVGL